MRLFSGMLPFVIAVAAVGGSIPVLPTIEVDEAVYADGYLTVTGETAKPNQRVGLDGRYFTKTNEDKQFRFHVHYVPSDCIITLSSGEENQLAVVRGCDVSDVPEAAPTKQSAPPASGHGSSSVSQ